METAAASTNPTRFAEFELDERLFELRRSGEVLSVEPKVFDVLCHLVRHRDRIVSKEELLESLWPEEHVSESVLPSNIRILRRLLGDNRSDQCFIRTLYRRGYRFVAPVVRDANGVAASTKTPRSGPFPGRAVEPLRPPCTMAGASVFAKSYH